VFGEWPPAYFHMFGEWPPAYFHMCMVLALFQISKDVKAKPAAYSSVFLQLGNFKCINGRGNVRTLGQQPQPSKQIETVESNTQICANET